MSIIDVILKILKAIFGIKEEVKEEPDNYIKLSENEIDYLLDGHSASEQRHILDTITKNETAKINKYRIEFSDGYYEIENGDIINVVLNSEPSDKMSISVRNFVLAGHKGADREDIERQINKAEDLGKTEYTISFPNGYYKIKNGQLVGGGKNAKK